MNGMVIPGTSIAVDIWRLKDVCLAKLFFLSHAHSDHMVGLTPSWKELIHTSPVTAKILIKKFKISQPYVVPLELGVPHLLFADNKQNESVTVTLFEAHHCPGSVMFLFQGCFGTILYTGDFRYLPTITKEIKDVYSGSIDRLYLDNTYNDSMCNFPTKELASKKIIELIQEKNNEDCEIVIGVRNLGKEDLLVDIATKLKSWIVVSVDQFELLQMLEVKNVFTTDVTASRIRAIPFHQVTSKRVKLWNLEMPSIAVLPTALYTGMTNRPFSKQPNIFVYPYSDHSSFTELQTFVREIRPKEVFPIVTHGRGPFGMNVSNRANMNAFSEFLDHSQNLSLSISLQESNSETFGSQLFKNKSIRKRKLSLQGRTFSVKRRKGVVYENQSPKNESKRCKDLLNPDSPKDKCVSKDLNNSEAKVFCGNNEYPNSTLDERPRIEPSDSAFANLLEYNSPNISETAVSKDLQSFYPKEVKTTESTNSLDLLTRKQSDLECINISKYNEHIIKAMQSSNSPIIDLTDDQSNDEEIITDECRITNICENSQKLKELVNRHENIVDQINIENFYGLHKQTQSNRKLNHFNYSTEIIQVKNFKLESYEKRKTCYLSLEQTTKVRFLFSDSSKENFNIENISDSINLHKELSVFQGVKQLSESNKISTVKRTSNNHIENKEIENEENCQVTSIKKPSKSAKENVHNLEIFPKGSIPISRSNFQGKNPLATMSDGTEWIVPLSSRDVYVPSFKISLIPVCKQLNAEQKRFALEKAFQEYYKKLE